MTKDFVEAFAIVKYIKEINTICKSFAFIKRQNTIMNLEDQNIFQTKMYLGVSFLSLFCQNLKEFCVLEKMWLVGITKCKRMAYFFSYKYFFKEEMKIKSTDSF